MIEISRQSDRYQLVTEQWLPLARGELFPFFADALNLERITPASLRFEVLTPAPIEMQRGTLIDYRLKIRGIPTRWRTEITAWDPPYRFVDEQLRGPYRLWRHEHRFEERDGGTLCRDRVEYRVPGGIFSAFVHRFFVERDVREIFGFRRRELARLFGGES